MNTINFQHASWADLEVEIQLMSPDYDSIHRRARELLKEGRQGPARSNVLRYLNLLSVDEVA